MAETPTDELHDIHNERRSSDLQEDETRAAEHTSVSEVLADPAEEHPPELPPRETDAMTEISQEHPQEQDSPQVAALKSMFPDFDSTVLQSVLESVNYDQDRAVDVLLGMSDPSYVPHTQPPAPTQPDLELDEQLARQLALEDDQRSNRHATGTSWPRRDDVPYQSRQNPAHPQAAQQDGYVTGSERGDFQEFQDTFNKFAESGRRTFSSIVSRAKAKINEYQQNRPPQSTDPYGQPQWGSTSPPQLDRHTAQQAYQSAYYGGVPAPAPQTPEQEGPYVQGYTVGPASHLPSNRGLDTPGSLSTRPPAIAPQSTSPLASPPLPPTSSQRPSSDVPRPPSTMTGSPINAAKLGLLPKRPVSLLNSQPTSAQSVQPSPQPRAPPERRPSDDLDYVENPFEEGEH